MRRWLANFIPAKQKSAASANNGVEAVRGGLFALALTLVMAVTIL
jgi:hypothetical protein